MFIKSDNHDSAQKVANFEMNARNWDKVNMPRIGTLNPDTFNSKDEPIKQLLGCFNLMGLYP